MNKVVKAENEKIAAIDFATAAETQADGLRRAEIKKAEGIKQAKVLAAEGEAQAIQPGQRGGREVLRRQRPVLRKLETVEKSLLAERQDHRAVRRQARQRDRRPGRHHAGADQGHAAQPDTGPAPQRR